MTLKLRLTSCLSVSLSYPPQPHSVMRKYVPMYARRPSSSLTPFHRRTTETGRTRAVVNYLRADAACVHFRRMNKGNERKWEEHPPRSLPALPLSSLVGFGVRVYVCLARWLLPRVNSRSRRFSNLRLRHGCTLESALPHDCPSVATPKRYP